MCLPVILSSEGITSSSHGTFSPASLTPLSTAYILDPATFVGMLIISAIGFAASFLMGSSGKFVAIAVLMSQVFGQQYFLWFFALDFTAYLLSPTHKCVMVGHKYFNTPLPTYGTPAISQSP